MKVITTQQMSELEKLTAKEYSISENTLMENAGAGIAKWIECFCSHKKLPKELLIFCGKGNNGGDGFVTARILSDNGFNAKIIFLASETDLKGCAKSNYRKIKTKKKISILKISNQKQLDKIKPTLNQYQIILDAIFGTGIKGEVKGFLRSVIESINELSQPIISIDIPSGMNGDSGLGYSIKAHTTLTMGLPKAGLLKPNSEESTGYLKVIDIGIPKEATKQLKTSLEYITKKDFSKQIPHRKLTSHKGTFGHVLVLAGSPQYAGAAYLCTQAAVLSGAGKVTLGIPKSLQSIYQTRLTEAMILPLKETISSTLSLEAFEEIKNFIEKVDAIALGPGLGTDPETVKCIKKIITYSDKPLIIDADGLNAIAQDTSVLKKIKAPIILTPHPGEMARLLNSSKKGILKDKWKITQGLAEKYGITVILKGYNSIVAGKDKKIYINGSGNPGMASGGMGDVLTGIIASLVAQGFKPLQAAKLGVYLHGAAGDRAAKEKGEWSLVASNLLDKLPYTMNSLYC